MTMWCVDKWRLGPSPKGSSFEELDTGWWPKGSPSQFGLGAGLS
jgi:hypothetical protein